MNENYSREIPQEWKTIGQVFLALGDEHRQRILLCFEPGEELTPTQISEVSTLSRAAVSHHLNILYRANVLQRIKRGTSIFYTINLDLLESSLQDVQNYIQSLRKAQA